MKNLRGKTTKIHYPRLHGVGIRKGQGVVLTGTRTTAGGGYRVLRKPLP